MATKAIVGEKVGMTQVWDDENRVVPVTVIQVAPVPRRAGEDARARRLQRRCRSPSATRRPRKLTKPEAGHFDKAGVEPGTKLVELRLDDVDGYEVGQEIKADVLAAGERVDVTAVSKGKGFAGVMKRHNFNGQGASPRQPQEAPLARLDRRLRHARPGCSRACGWPAAWAARRSPR